LQCAAVFGEHPDSAEVARLHHVGAARAHGCHGFDGDDGVHQRTADAAVLFRHGDAQQALPGHVAGHIPGVVVGVGAFDGAVAQFAFGEAAHGGLEILLFRSQLEVHLGSS
jgi:hypothetical protein